MSFCEKIKRKWSRISLQPIRVFCFHHVSDTYNPLTMWKCDWTQTEQFKSIINDLKDKGYEFISLSEAYEKLQYDRFRRTKYAVLTADDGYKSILSILPWLEEQKIPITLFVNTKYLDGKSWSTISEEQARRVKPDVDMLKNVCSNLYMSKEELFALSSPLIFIGLHGHEHLDATKQTTEDFCSNVERCREILKSHPRYIPYYAYPWGYHSEVSMEKLKEMDLIPVWINGEVNYKYNGYIDRIAIEGQIVNKKSE